MDRLLVATVLAVLMIGCSKPITGEYTATRIKGLYIDLAPNGTATGAIMLQPVGKDALVAQFRAAREQPSLEVEFAVPQYERFTWVRDGKTIKLLRDPVMKPKWPTVVMMIDGEDLVLLSGERFARSKREN